MAARGWSVFILCLLVATLRMGFTWVESRYSFRSRPFRLRGLERQARQERSSYDSSPEWTKSVVNGLTGLVNGVMGGEAPPLPQRRFDKIGSQQLLEGIRADFEERQYLWSGDIDLELYDEDCSFTDPTISFQGLSKFQSNMRSLAPIVDTLVPKEKRRCILRDIKLDNGEVFAKWRMVGDIQLPWSPRIDIGGQTRYSPGTDGRIQTYFEQWDIDAGEALAQLVQPRREAVDHWPMQLDGAPPPKPAILFNEPQPVVLLPGFGNDARDYSEPLGQDEAVGLRACLERRNLLTSVVPVKRSDWLRVFVGILLDDDARAGNGTAQGAYKWYLDLTQEAIEDSFRSTGKAAVLVGHSAGGWLGRAVLEREGREWTQKHVQGLVTLGTPHKPPPEGQMDMTFGCLRNLNKAHPGAYFSDDMFYVSIAGDAVVGQKIEGNIPIVELIQSPSPESTAWNSYQALGGVGNLTGDGLVPVEWAHLPGAEQLTIKGCLHSINIAGTTLPTNSSYLCESFVDQWLEKVLGAVNAVSATSGA
ncbi:unnamed protein product [Durusdinium trenchii]|uniref:GPI inositol-deacylase n=1 Tax=Durusdinium trenchii TaxID=1381693 RepID=A0ABP0KHT7_9DINO